MNQDELAKERARSRPATTPAGSPPSSSPADAAARLDERIAGQRQDYGDEEAKNRARSAGVGMEVQQRAPTSSLSREERDAAAKDRARGGGASSSLPKAPGAYNVIAASGGRNQLADLESDVAIKARNARPASPAVSVQQSSTGGNVRTELSQLEADITAKSPRRIPSISPGVVSVRSSGAVRTDLNQLEADIAAKSRAAHDPSNISRINDAPAALSSRTDLSQLEADVASKSRARPPTRSDSKTPGLASSSPGARHELNSMEDALATKTSRNSQAAGSTTRSHQLHQLEADVVAKQNSTRGGVVQGTGRPAVQHLSGEEIARLDERIAYKTGIPLGNDPPVPEEVKEDYHELNVLPKPILIGVAPNTTNAVQAKLSAQETNVLAHMENSYKVDYRTPEYDLHGAIATDVESRGDVEDKLAVAIAVKDEDDDAFIPAAVEYDPDAKPPIFKNRRFRLYCALAGILLLVIVGGLAFGLLSKDNGGSKNGTVVVVVDGPSPSPQDTSVPTTFRESLGIRDQLELVVGKQKLDDVTTPHYRAMQWIINDDPFEVLPDDLHLIQRYLLAVFYFSTTEKGEWFSCGPNYSDYADSYCVFKLLNSVNVPSPWLNTYVGVADTRWLSVEHECDWAGISCDDFNQTRVINICKYTWGFSC
jgi:hypothetical protein